MYWMDFIRNQISKILLKLNLRLILVEFLHLFYFQIRKGTINCQQIRHFRSFLYVVFDLIIMLSTSSIESVLAFLILSKISSGLSNMLILLKSLGSDFDIFFLPSLRFIILGALDSIYSGSTKFKLKREFNLST